MTTGIPWPDDSSTHPVGNVVLLSAEDDLGDTIRPRLDAAGADVNKIIALQVVRGRDGDGTYDRMFDLDRDMPKLETAIVSQGDVEAGRGRSAHCIPRREGQGE